MRARKQHKRRKDTRSNPKIGKLVVNRQRTTYGMLLANGKIIYWLAAKESRFNKMAKGWSISIVGIRIGNLRVM